MMKTTKGGKKQEKLHVVEGGEGGSAAEKKLVFPFVPGTELLYFLLVKLFCLHPF